MMLKRIRNFKLAPLRRIAASLEAIEHDALNKNEARYKPLYEYITKQYEIELSRTRALEGKTASLLTAISLLGTAYSSMLVLHFKAGFSLNLWHTYALISIGSLALGRALWFWWKAASVKEFEAPNITTIKDNVRNKLKEPEAVYLHLYNNIQKPTKQRRDTNLKFGQHVAKIIRSVGISLIFLLLSIVTVSFDWYSEQVSPEKENSNITVTIMSNYVEPEDLPADDVDIMMEGVEPSADFPTEEDEQ